MNNQLSWNIPLETVLKNFKARMANSKIIVRAVMIIEQANKSGGNIEDTMESLAFDIESIKDVQKEKALLLNEQVIMMYAIFFIFLGITIALIKFLIPMLNTEIGMGGFGTYGVTKFSANPCYLCIDSNDPACIGCEVFGGVSYVFGFGDEKEPAAYYRSLFFMMILVQGFFTGLIAGQIGSDSVAAGVKHSMVMLLVGFVTFMTVVKLGVI
jgi:flagellar protein FlaJ